MLLLPPPTPPPLPLTCTPDCASAVCCSCCGRDSGTVWDIPAKRIYTAAQAQGPKRQHWPLLADLAQSVHHTSMLQWLESQQASHIAQKGAALTRDLQQQHQVERRQQGDCIAHTRSCQGHHCGSRNKPMVTVHTAQTQNIHVHHRLRSSRRKHAPVPGTRRVPGLPLVEGAKNNRM